MKKSTPNLISCRPHHSPYNPLEIGLIILFIVVGLIFLLIEILITPGVMLGIVGIFFIALGIWRSYYSFGSTVGNIVLISVFTGTVASIILALKGGVWKRMASNETIASRAVEDVNTIVKVGDIGKTLSALRPSGNAVFGEHKTEVATLGEPVEPGQTIEVIQIERNKIIVRKHQNSEV
ncbi:MAG: hypothetical protein GC181_09690 [Bacteroidetes bacterium]|nr:hypothetical protein [Bacteroidota bacterium]